MCNATCGATGASEVSARLASPTRRPWSLDLFVRQAARAAAGSSRVSQTRLPAVLPLGLRRA
eukprot:14190861-Heterocapsa_arctica.AAC.1